MDEEGEKEGENPVGLGNSHAQRMLSSMLEAFVGVHVHVPGSGPCHGAT